MPSNGGTASSQVSGRSLASTPGLTPLSVERGRKKLAARRKTLVAPAWLPARASGSPPTGGLSTPLGGTAMATTSASASGAVATTTPIIATAAVTAGRSVKVKSGSDVGTAKIFAPHRRRPKKTKTWKKTWGTLPLSPTKSSPPSVVSEPSRGVSEQVEEARAADLLLKKKKLEYAVTDFPVLAELTPDAVTKFLLEFGAYEAALKDSLGLESATLARSIKFKLRPDLEALGVVVSDRAGVLAYRGREGEDPHKVGE